MKKKIFLLIAIIPFILYSQTNNNFKTISGFIYHEKAPLAYVKISISDTITSTSSDSKGFYKIDAKAGDILSFKYPGLKNSMILVEDVTATLNIVMRNKNTILKNKQNKLLKLGGSNIGSSSTNVVIIAIDGKSLDKNAATLTAAILEKIPFLHAKQNNFGENILYIKGAELDGPVLWEIDDFYYNIPIPIYISEVKNVTILNSDLNGCIIKVKTTIDYSKIEDINYDNYFFSDVDYYNYDAILYKDRIVYTPDYIHEFKNTATSKEALHVYLEQHSKYKTQVNYHFNIINYLEKKYADKDILLKVLSDYEELATSNPEDLKAIAYKYQELNEHTKALVVYKKLVNLRPEYAQSYRDLAQAFLDLKDYRSTWLIYKFYLNKGFKIENNDIGEIFSSEIISSYHKDKNGSHKKIKISNVEKTTKSDVRLVFEWNTSEAEFILEFVNPNDEVYAIENSTKINNDLIIDQKKKGYTSKEILIERLKYGDWLVNFTYLGNKQYKPTILKVTSYYNWGKPNQRKQINVYEFTIHNVKTQLLKLNSYML
ncbi:hypothetical protein [uncultured Polaribacter sp.]|uniref:hypothetical protein n=1 Tax=uncultured Polaribacter sp. TaxID=174711 RepID=UPI00261A0C0D|nr:hypothetical protein [uncultured Polaribacter sp.]